MLSSRVQYRLSVHDDSIQTTLQCFFEGEGQLGIIANTSGGCSKGYGHLQESLDISSNNQNITCNYQ